MPIPILLPRQGQSVESCLINAWKKQVGQFVRVGDIVCEVETDKALMEIESPAEGFLLATFFEVGEDVPVQTVIAALGAAGEDPSPLNPRLGGAASAPVAPMQAVLPPAPLPAPHVSAPSRAEEGRISPRARKLAQSQGLSWAGLVGSGPRGRIMERDIRALMARLAQAAPPEAVEVIPVKGARKVIAERMLASLQTTAQLTLNASADARALQAYRARLKASDPPLGLTGVSVNDLILFAVARLLTEFPAFNAHFTGTEIRRFAAVHLGVAVDTERGLLVPVVKNAQRLSLKALSDEVKTLARAAQEGKIAPEDLTGGTFTVTNLGAFGIETFTPILNPPQVAILGVGNISLKPVQSAQGIDFIPHLNLSLTVDHQVLDGAPAARFLQALGATLADFDLLLAR